MKSAFLASVTLTLAGIGLAACGQIHPNRPSPWPKSRPMPCPNRGDPRAAGAPRRERQSGSVYFEVANNGEKDTAIVGAFVDGAKEAMPHTSVEKDGVMSMNHTMEVPLAKGGAISFCARRQSCDGAGIGG